MTLPCPHYDVTVIGAGPVGVAAAVAHARAGAHVALLEAGTEVPRRLAGEWLHPRAIGALDALGIALPASARAYDAGRGFVVYPEDGSAPVTLPYADGRRGASLDHVALLGALRAAARAQPGVECLFGCRVNALDGDQVLYTARGAHAVSGLRTARVVGADGRRSVVRAALGLPNEHVRSSGMLGLVLHGASLPYEGYGHVFLGGPGPVLAYRIARDRVRIIADVPLAHAGGHDRRRWLWEGYAPMLPQALHEAFRAALPGARLQGAVNEIRPRSDYGAGPWFLAGDAVGHYHPLTAVGLTLGFEDAVALPHCTHADDYRARRAPASRVPEMLAIGLHEAFSDRSDEGTAIRHAVIAGWRGSAGRAARTMRYLGCDDVRVGPYACSFAGTLLRAGWHLAGHAARHRDWRASLGTGVRIVQRARGLTLGVRRMRTARSAGEDRAAGALLLDGLRGDGGIGDTAGAPVTPLRAPAPRDALTRGVQALRAAQHADGRFEGEVVWCPMLAAQYVMTCQMLGITIDARRRARLRVHFERTRDPRGLWGLHPHSPPYLYVTTLVYVAARLLGVPAGDALLAPAARSLHDAGGVVAIPTWGKFWLAMLGLYRWQGVHPVPPEAWRLPHAFPLHPRRLYCHTRLIYMAMSVIWAERVQAPGTSVLESLREELYPDGFARVDFARARDALHADDVHARPGLALRALRLIALAHERVHRPARRAACVAVLRERIREELRASAYTSISPVSGLLNVIALSAHDPHDADARRAVDALDGWLWEDDRGGTRMCGARSASWDSAFAAQALEHAPGAEARSAARRARAFLRGQQIRHALPGIAAGGRIDPRGGWCFAGVWHGWPVSDCTAEALLALVDEPLRGDDDAAAAGVDFMLRCQNRDGGFGSYEASGTGVPLEWLNPSELFGDCMTDRSWVECTASCVAALAAWRDRLDAPRRARAEAAISRGAGWLARVQRADGAWAGAWGVGFVYGTLFGIRGLLAAGAPPVHPAVVAACRWLARRQHADGGWGEHHASCLDGEYRDAPHSHAVQTAWALLALLEAGDPNGDAIERGARRLAAMQGADGRWPRQAMTGVFFRTALLDYTLYRSYFPLWALALYERRRLALAPLAGDAPDMRAAASGAAD